MKAFISGTLAVLVISIGAALALESLGWSSSEIFSSPNVRQDAPK